MQQRTILVVDDDERHRRLLYDVLSAKCYRVLLAETGGSAIELARRTQPELILLDIRLPDMSGLEVARVLKAASDTKAIPIAATTALAMPGDERAVREGGCEGYLAKPIRLGRLYILVSGLLRQSGKPETRDRGVIRPTSIREA